MASNRIVKSTPNIATLDLAGRHGLVLYCVNSIDERESQAVIPATMRIPLLDGRLRGFNDGRLLRQEIE